MSKILALDTATDACSVALNINGVITEEFTVVAREHTQRLLPMVHSVLSQQNCSLQDLDAIAFTRGPGSFTGVRICLGIVQGLAFGANLPVIPISTLAVMAEGVRRLESQAQNRRLLLALDARMGEVYWCAFDAQGRAGEECVISPEALLERRELWAESSSALAIGPGWHYEAMNGIEREALILECHPRAYDLASLASLAYERGEMVSAELAQPVYLRDTVSWKKRQKKRQ